MKVISNDGESVLVEFDNLVQQTNVIGVSAPVRAKFHSSQLAGLEKIRQAGQRSAQQFNQMMADVPHEIH
ncbi:MAG: hypothetical protein A2494_00785 [Candidatus Lloydbacteria bacterium RIFOXYC12_FULL_46_25]|uniref:Uncharacterized protein n=1 Tax=Candidatus Lloydbacteria bacterium RIFOXYC12_FULL_46_25 TaxID=1798670 RepID=A0A1G2DTQ1_9BACT|nr:MAG: hypothetical protein A2494_00785 [Candidatus Lloydbacteria bacterium RIFOXYC12_FULL_46_25]